MKPTAIEQIINSLEEEMIKCSEEIKTAEEPKKSELMEIANTAFKEVYRLFEENGEVPTEKLFQIAELYKNTASDYEK